MKETRIMKVFEQYIKDFDMNKGNVKAVYFHSIKMMDLCKDIARNLGIFTEDEIIICGLIGLFHDIGTFDNKKKFSILEEESIDYSKKSVEILFNDNKMIREITDEKTYDDVIKIAIYCQNKIGLPNGLGDKMLHFCKVLKDAHTIDDFRLATNYPYLDRNIDNLPTSLVYNTFKKYQPINNKITDNEADKVLVILSQVFSINYKYTINILKEENCIDKFLNSLRINDKNVMQFFKQIGAVLNMYIDRKTSL